MSESIYEQLRDDILMLYDFGMDEFSSYKVRYEVAGTDIEIVNN